MNRLLLLLLLTGAIGSHCVAQSQFSQVTPDGNITRRETAGRTNADSLGTDKQIPIGIKVWTVDPLLGDRREATPDTVPHMYMNSIFTTGLRGEYNTLGNLGSPRLNRIFIDRQEGNDFIFTYPYDFFITRPEDFHFTNTLSPFTNLSYNTAGNRTNGEDHFTAKFGVNAGKRLGVGFKFDYLYGRGYYQNQSTSHFNYTMYGSYLGDRYQAHLLLSTNHQKVAESGGIANDNYITHPETFNDNYATNEIPTVLEQNWNRNDNQHLFLTHRYSLGFNRKVKMTEEEIKAKQFALDSKKENDALKNKEEERKRALKEGRTFDEEQYDRQQTFSGRPSDARIAGAEPTDSTLQASARITVDSRAKADSLLAADKKQREDTLWLKNEYVPVTSFIHTLTVDNYRRIYQAYDTPDQFYAYTYYNKGALTGDSIYDKTRHYVVKNTFAIALLEGFNKWAKAGLRVFTSHELRHFSLPDTEGGYTDYNKHALSVGGQLLKTQGRLLHYQLTGEYSVLGDDQGDMSLNGNADLNFALFGDSAQIAVNAFVTRKEPLFYHTHYHSRHLWWDNEDMDKIFHSRLEGRLRYEKTKTTLRLAVDEIKNYTYLSMGYTINEDNTRSDYNVHARQCGETISLLTVSLAQDLRLGPLNWENVITYQNSSKQDVIPVPALNLYSNLFLRFKVAHVLKCDFGADVRFFTKYQAPDYSAAMGSFAVQEGPSKVEVGNYPIVNVYANFHLKHTRFFAMMSHINAGSGKRNYFLTPHYPLNERIFRFGLSWNFFN